MITEIHETPQEKSFMYMIVHHRTVRVHDGRTDIFTVYQLVTRINVGAEIGIFLCDILK